MDGDPDVLLGSRHDIDGTHVQLRWSARRKVLFGCNRSRSTAFRSSLRNTYLRSQSGFFPAATFLLTLWYRRFELQRRMAVFYVAASLAGAFSGLLAYGIEQLDGRSGLAGWQWIFLIEGLIPVALALIIWKILPDSPETAKFLTQPERDLLVSRLANDSGSGQGQATNSDKIGKEQILAGLSDWKIWAATVVFWGNTVGVYG